MANQSKLKAWVRYDGTNTVVTAGPIFRASKPKVGNWRQINADLCCNPSGTTTTTTTGGGGVTPTAWVGQISATGNSDQWKACNGLGDSTIVYTSTSVEPFVPGTTLYSDAALTLLIPYSFGSLSVNGTVYEIVNGQTNPLGGTGTPCAYITTTTSTTQAPVVYDFVGGYGVGSRGEACFAGMTQTFYSTTPYGSVTNGSVLYSDAGLTTPVTYPYVALTGLGIVFDCSNGVLSNQGGCF